MARILKVKELELRRRVLVAESELYRQTLRLEARNLQLYALRYRRKFDFLKALNPLLLLGTPLLGAFFRSRRAPARRGWLGTVLRGWQFYRRFGPVLRSFMGRASQPGAAEARRSASS